MDSATCDRERGIVSPSLTLRRPLILAAAFMAALGLTLTSATTHLIDYDEGNKYWDDGCVTWAEGYAFFQEAWWGNFDETAAWHDDTYNYCATNVAAKALIQEYYPPTYESTWDIQPNQAVASVYLYRPAHAYIGQAKFQAQINGIWTSYYGAFGLQW